MGGGGGAEGEIGRVNCKALRTVSVNHLSVQTLRRLVLPHQRACGASVSKDEVSTDWSCLGGASGASSVWSCDVSVVGSLHRLVLPRRRASGASEWSCDVKEWSCAGVRPILVTRGYIYKLFLEILVNELLVVLSSECLEVLWCIIL